MSENKITKYNKLFFIYFLILCIILVSPSAFNSVINWDESVYILMGNSITHGYLPYVKVWDNKPPIGFLFYALPQFLFNDSLLAIRMFCAGYLAVSGYLCYLISREKGLNLALSIIAGTMTVGIITKIIPGGSGLMLETVAIMPLLLAFYLLVLAEYKVDQTICIEQSLIGFLFSISIFTRSNLAIAVGVFLLLGLVFKRSLFKLYIRISLLTALFCLLFLLILILIYYIDGNQLILIKTLFSSPLKYISNQSSYIDILGQFFEIIYSFRWDLGDRVITNQLIRGVYWSTFILSLFYLVIIKKTAGVFDLLSMSLGVFLSILASRHAFDHYLIQLIPFSSILIAILLNKLSVKPIDKFYYVLAPMIASLFISLSSFNSYFTFLDNLVSNNNRDSLHNIGNKLKQLKPSKDASLLAINDPILYFLSDSPPPAPIAAFPHNIKKEAGLLSSIYKENTSPDDVFDEIFNLNPPYAIVINDEKFKEPNGFSQYKRLVFHMSYEYKKVFFYGGNTIYVRNTLPKGSL